MKHLIFLAFLLVIGWTANAQHKDLVISATSINELRIGGHMNVVLVPTTSAQSALAISDDVTDRFEVSIGSGVLNIQSRTFLAKPVTVYVLVKNVRRITLGEQTTLMTHGILQSGPIDLFLEQGAVAKLRTDANIRANGIGDTDVKVTRSIATQPKPEVLVNSF